MASRSTREMIASVANRYSRKKWESGWAPNGTEVEGPWQPGIIVVYKLLGRKYERVRVKVVKIVKGGSPHWRKLTLGETMWLSEGGSKMMFYK